MVRVTGRETLIRLNPGPAHAALHGLHGRVHEEENLRALDFLSEHGVQLVKGAQSDPCPVPEVTRKLFDHIGPDPVVLSVGIPVPDDPGGMECRLFCRHESVPLELCHKPLIPVKDLNEKRHLTQGMG
jgi:hypothetical protein